MNKFAIGHVACPICGHAGAEVKEDKNSRAYIHCKFECSWQGITRNDYQSDQLKARMTPVAAPVTVPTVTVQEPVAPKAPTATAPAPRPPGAAKAPAAPAKPAAPATTPAPAPAKRSWLTPIMGADNA